MSLHGLGTGALALALVLGAGSAHAADGASRRSTRSTRTPSAAEQAAIEGAIAVGREKRTFMLAVELCSSRDTCDKELLADAESRFMKACQACAAQDRCDAERELINSGTASRRSNPCR